MKFAGTTGVVPAAGFGFQTDDAFTTLVLLPVAVSFGNVGGCGSDDCVPAFGRNSVGAFASGPGGVAGAAFGCTGGPPGEGAGVGSGTGAGAGPWTGGRNWPSG